MLGWLSPYVPYLAVVLPAPMALLTFRHGVTAAISAWVVAAVLSAVLLGGLGGVLVLIPAGLTGLTLGMALHARFPPGRVLAVALVGALVAILLSLGISFFLVGINPLEQTLRMYEEAMMGGLDLYRRLGLSPEQLRDVETQIRTSLELLRLVLPVVLLGAAAVSALVNYWAVRGVLIRLGEKVPWFEPFARWRSSPLAAAMVATGLLLGAFGTAHPWLPMISANLTFGGAVVAFVQGLSLLWFWFERAQLSKAVRFLLLLMVLWLPIVNLALVAAGLVDPWFNFRGL